MGLRSHPRGRGPRTSAAARRPHGSRSCPAPRCASVPATLGPPNRLAPSRRSCGGSRHACPSEENCFHEDWCPTRDGGRGDARRAHAADRRPARRRRPRGARPGRCRRRILEPRRGLPRGGRDDRPRRGVALQPGGDGAPRRPALGRGGRDAEVRVGPHRHPGHPLEAGARAEARGTRGHGDQHGRHPAHHSRPVDGHALQPGHGRRLQGGPDRRGPAAEVLPAPDHRRRHDPAGSRDRHGRRRGRADGDRHGTAARRGCRGHRRAPGRQGAGRVPRRHLHRGRDDRGGEEERRDRRRLRDRDERRLQASPGRAHRRARQGGRLHHHDRSDSGPSGADGSSPTRWSGA